MTKQVMLEDFEQKNNSVIIISVMGNINLVPNGAYHSAMHGN